MVVEQVLLRQFRHFKNTMFAFAPDSNLIVGPNGSGKTSLLESIYFLAYAKSFRSHTNRHIIAYQQDYLQVDAKIHFDNQLLVLNNLYSHQQDLRKIQINQDHQVKQSDIAKMLPVVFIDTSTHREFADTPSNRRDFINWCCFYTDSDYHNNLSKFQRVLQQRNQLLKQYKKQPTMQPSLLSTWTEPLVFYAQKVHDARLQLIEQLNDHLHLIWPHFFETPCAIVSYQQGWKNSIGYLDCLAQSLDQDKLYGHTQFGPHRADLQCLTHQESPLFHTFSQGQQKLFSYIMKFIQLHLVTTLRKQKGILLIDDLPAELDQVNQAKIIDFIGTLDCQKFLTALDPTSFQTTYSDTAIFVDQSLSKQNTSHSPTEIYPQPIAIN